MNCYELLLVNSVAATYARGAGKEGRRGLSSKVFVLVGVHCLMLIYTT